MCQPEPAGHFHRLDHRNNDQKTNNYTGKGPPEQLASVKLFQFRPGQIKPPIVSKLSFVTFSFHVFDFSGGNCEVCSKSSSKM